MASGRGLVSVIKNSDGELGLRIDKVLNLNQHGINHKTVMPLEGLVVPLIARLIHKSTKMSEADMDKHANQVLIPVSRLPWYPAKPDPFDLYQYGELNDIYPAKLPANNAVAKSSRTQVASDPARTAPLGAVPPPHPANNHFSNASALIRGLPSRPDPRWTAGPRSRPTDTPRNTPSHHYPQTGASSDADQNPRNFPSRPDSRNPPWDAAAPSRYNYPKNAASRPDPQNALWDMAPPSRSADPRWASGRPDAARDAVSRNDARRASSPPPTHSRTSTGPNQTHDSRWR
ncbi:hypothetical protein B0H12DRAFT_777193 [Mycena haematopus]|nr:hypothetical protein B0H12DRAFT_777193 [Mycena haematopus]